VCSGLAISYKQFYASNLAEVESFSIPNDAVEGCMKAAITEAAHFLVILFITTWLRRDLSITFEFEESGLRWMKFHGQPMDNLYLRQKLIEGLCVQALRDIAKFVGRGFKDGSSSSLSFY
jgi:hypothetical protein